jgi:hypothetical protein
MINPTKRRARAHQPRWLLAILTFVNDLPRDLKNIGGGCFRCILGIADAAKPW